MAQRLCKLSRHDITASLSDIHRIVAAPNYLCRSCARSSSDKKRLCKPQAFSVNAPAVKESTSVNKSSKAALKVAKKTLKAEKKYQKKLEKVLKKQQALQLKFSKLNPVSNGEYSLTSQYH
ncbi:MAG: hypothetical protein ACK5MF_13035 [Vibrio sp.]|uniref:hypothetical protein n=1 Tax=Vibrio sp. TaxID=678 RepID=UPI003A88875E